MHFKGFRLGWSRLALLGWVITAGTVAPTASLAQSNDDLSGTVTISLQSNDTQTWNAVARTYEDLHPNVTVNVELKPQEGYQEFLRAQFAAGTPRASLVNLNVVQDLINEDKFLDFAAYLDDTNPYTGKSWRESLDETAVANMVSPEGEMYALNLETVQVLWFYNQQAFAEAGILEEAEALAETERNQPSWTQFLGWCDQLTEAGYIPVAIEGDFNSFWQFRFGWLARIYIDQYTRDWNQLVRCQEGDYCFREGVDDQWTYDPSDPGNDDATKLTLNISRQMNALRDGTTPIDGPEFRALYTNLKEFSDRCTPPGWIGTTDAYPLFLTQKAAIRLDVATLLTSFEKDIRSLSEGEYVPADAAEGETLQEDTSAFEIGSFNMPSMEGPEVDAPARTIEVTTGFLGVPRKDRQQNDLEVDFLMYLTSPEGFGTYLANTLDPANLRGSIAGPPIVKDVALPDAYAEQFSQLRLIGNMEKNTAGRLPARGVADYQPSVREWVDLSQQYFNDGITLDQFLGQYDASIDRLFPELLEHLQLVEGDLATPAKTPVNQD